MLAAKRIARQEGSCLHGERLNSGVVLMNLRRMRLTRWTDQLLGHAARLSARVTPARECGNMVRNGTVRAGDQELLGLACFKAAGECVSLPPRFHQDKCEGMARSDAVIYHFNCKSRPETHCPRGSCMRLALEFAVASRDLASRRPRGALVVDQDGRTSDGQPTA